MYLVLGPWLVLTKGVVIKVILAPFLLYLEKAGVIVLLEMGETEAQSRGWERCSRWPGYGRGRTTSRIGCDPAPCLTK